MPIEMIVSTTRGPVDVADTGAGSPILYYHGTGAANDIVLPLEGALVADGFRLIAPNRPGYGNTPLAAGASTGECADLAAQVLDVLQLPKVAVMGSSGGGPFAVAFAARYPQRVTCLVLACAQVHRWDHRRWLPVQSRWTLPLLARPKLRRWLLWGYRRQFQRLSPRAFLQLESGERFCEVQDDPTALELCRASVESMRRGVHEPGFENDFEVFVSENVLEPGAVACPTLVIHDPCDPIVPVDHADWTIDCIPHAERFDVHAAGHLVWVGRDAEAMHARRVQFLRQHG